MTDEAAPLIAPPPAFLLAAQEYDVAVTREQKEAAVEKMLVAREALYGAEHDGDDPVARHEIEEQKEAIQVGLKSLSEDTHLVAGIVGEGIVTQNLLKNNETGLYERNAHRMIREYLGNTVASDFVATAKMTLDFIATRHAATSQVAAHVDRDIKDRLSVLRENAVFTNAVPDRDHPSKNHHPSR